MEGDLDASCTMTELQLLNPGWRTIRASNAVERSRADELPNQTYRTDLSIRPPPGGLFRDETDTTSAVDGSRLKR